jgi:hypothetical protein
MLYKKYLKMSMLYSHLLVQNKEQSDLHVFIILYLNKCVKKKTVLYIHFSNLNFFWGF